MGTSHTVAGFVHKIDGLAQATERGTKAGVLAGAKLAKELQLVAGAEMSGGDLVLSHVGRSGGKLGVGYQIEGTGSLTTATVQARGPWPIVNNKTTPHLIGVGRRKTKKRGYLMAPGAAHPVLGPIAHPGTKGKGGWQKAATAAVKPVSAVIAKGPTNEIRRVLG